VVRKIRDGQPRAAAANKRIESRYHGFPAFQPILIIENDIHICEGSSVKRELRVEIWELSLGEIVRNLAASELAMGCGSFISCPSQRVAREYRCQ